MRFFGLVVGYFLCSSVARVSAITAAIATTTATANATANATVAAVAIAAAAAATLCSTGRVCGTPPGVDEQDKDPERVRIQDGHGGEGVRERVRHAHEDRGRRTLTGTRHPLTGTFGPCLR